MNKQRKTLIILTPAFAANETDSYLPAQESFISSLNKNYPSLRIIILTFHFPVTNQPSYNWHGNKVFTFSGALKGKINSLILWKRVWQKLSSLQKEFDLIGIFSFFCSESAFIGHHFAKRKKLRHHIWVLGQDAKKENKQVKRIRPNPEELIVISDFLRKEFERNHKIKPSHTIPIGIDPDDFSKDIPERTIGLIGAGSLSALKQYNVFLNVVKEIIEKCPDVHAVICGNGPEETNLRNQIGELDIAENITMTGLKKDRPEVLDLLLQSKILLHTSSYEGFGMICTEALYAGAHVISFIKPMDENIKHWHIVKDPAAMALKAIELLQDINTTYYSVLPYSMNDTADAIMQLFNYQEFN